MRILEQPNYSWFIHELLKIQIKTLHFFIFKYELTYILYLSMKFLFARPKKKNSYTLYLIVDCLIFFFLDLLYIAAHNIICYYFFN